MDTAEQQLETIHESLVNGQRQQMVRQIDEYGLCDFWATYSRYLGELYYNPVTVLEYFQDAVVSYHRIKNR